MDSRVKYSKLQIRPSVEALLSEKPMERIQLTEVCSRAGVNRSTFYRYYDSLSDWCEQMRRAIINADPIILDEFADSSLAGRIRCLTAFLKDNGRLFNELLTDDEQYTFLDHLFADTIDTRDGLRRAFAYAGLLRVCEKQLADGDDSDLADEAAVLVNRLFR